jgi:hypothetical protein
MKFPLLSPNPVLCGLSTLAVQLTEQEYATGVADKWWNIFPACHLYNVLKASSFINFEWKAIENFISAYTPDFVFLGNRPTELSESLKRLKLVTSHVDGRWREHANVLYW